MAHSSELASGRREVYTEPSNKRREASATGAEGLRSENNEAYTSHIEQSGTVGSTGNLIHLYFTKPVTAAANLSSDNTAVQSLRILIDDYMIVSAPIPVPDDKGLLHSKIRLEPRNMKIISEDTLYHC